MPLLSLVALAVAIPLSLSRVVLALVALSNETLGRPASTLLSSPSRLCTSEDRTELALAVLFLPLAIESRSILCRNSLIAAPPSLPNVLAPDGLPLPRASAPECLGRSEEACVALTAVVGPVVLFSEGKIDVAVRA